jgi:hypothetical protein
MDALERCARMVRDSEDANGRMPDAHYIDVWEWGEIQAVILAREGASIPQSLNTLEVCGVPVRKF